LKFFSQYFPKTLENEDFIQIASCVTFDSINKTASRITGGHEAEKE
jgi:hypothetical protein